MRKILKMLFKKDILRFVSEVRSHKNLDRRDFYKLMKQKYGWTESKVRMISRICIYCGLTVRRRV